MGASDSMDWSKLLSQQRQEERLVQATWDAHSSAKISRIALLAVQLLGRRTKLGLHLSPCFFMHRRTDEPLNKAWGGETVSPTQHCHERGMCLPLLSTIAANQLFHSVTLLSHSQQTGHTPRDKLGKELMHEQTTLYRNTNRPIMWLPIHAYYVRHRTYLGASTPPTP